MNTAVSTKENIYRFDDITIDVENFRAQRDGQNVTLTPRAFDVLTFLIQNAGRAVEKREIFEHVWKDAFVTDNALTKIIKEIRHTLEDSATEPRYIETIPKRGYRFIGKLKENLKQKDFETEENQSPQVIVQEKRESVQSISESFQEQISSKAPVSKSALSFLAIILVSISILIGWLIYRHKSAESMPAPIQSLAVLPFKPLNADSSDESLEMGMAETLVTRLSNLKQVVVRPMSASRKFTNLQQDPVKAGQEMQAEAVLDGSIQKAGDRIRVTVRLIDVRSGMPLWSEQFDENFTDIFKVQDSIAERVTNSITPQLSKQEKDLLVKHYTNSPEAYQLYLRGQLLWHRRLPNWIEQSLEFYQQALEQDPNFALAHIGVAECQIMLSGHGKLTMQVAEAKARPSIVKALELDDNLAQSHNALAELKYQYEYDWAGAEKEFKRAIELNPNIAWIRQAYGWFLMSMGRFEEAESEMDKARELDPSSLTINVGRGRLYYYSRQYDKALQHFQNIVAVEPNDASSYYALYGIYEQKQMYPEAVEALLKNMSLNGDKPERIEELRESFRVSGWQGFLNKQLEYLEAVRTAGEKAGKTGYLKPNGFANLYVRLGQKEKALEWFERAFETRHVTTLQFKIEPAYDILRDDARYAKLVRQIGLEP